MVFMLVGVLIICRVGIKQNFKTFFWIMAFGPIYSRILYIIERVFQAQCLKFVMQGAKYLSDPS